MRLLNANADKQGALLTCKVIIQIIKTRLVYFKIHSDHRDENSLLKKFFEVGLEISRDISLDLY